MDPISVTPAGLGITAGTSFALSAASTIVGLAIQASAHKTEMLIKVLGARTKAQVELWTAASKSHDAAADRKIDGGKTLRYWLALAFIACLLNLIVAPLMGQPIIVRDETEIPAFLGIFPQPVKITYTYLRGYFFAPITVYALTAYVSCLVGSAAPRLKL